MQTVKEAWGVLNQGGTISNDEITVTYADGQLMCDPAGFSLIPFDKDNIEDWYEVVESTEQMYCRWYRETDTIEIIPMFHKVEEESTDGWLKMNEAFTREEILGL